MPLPTHQVPAKHGDEAVVRVKMGVAEMIARGPFGHNNIKTFLRRIAGQDRMMLLAGIAYLVRVYGIMASSSIQSSFCGGGRVRSSSLRLTRAYAP